MRQAHLSGRFRIVFATYDFQEVLYSYRNAGIKGSFAGEIRQNPNGTKTLFGQASFLFYDQFKDPLDIAQIYVNAWNKLPFSKISEVDLWELFRQISNLWQKPYPITGEWEITYKMPFL